MVEWESVLREAVERVQSVRDRLVASQEGTERLGEGAGGDMTMRVDQEAEDEILQVVRQKKEVGDGDLRIVAEEHGESGPRGARWTIIIDPIDGSTNFEKQIPFYCTSIAVLEGPSLGDAGYAVVRNLVNGDTYYAEASGYSTKNGHQIKTSEVEKLHDAILGIDLSRAAVPVLRSLEPLIASAKRQTHLGATALETCLLAEGKIDGILDVRRKLRVVDFAAGYLIARQAGATFTDERGTTLAPQISVDAGFSMVGAANQVLHRKILAKLAEAPPSSS